MNPLLQIALDLIDLEKAVSIAIDALNGGADLIEAGTPLLQKFGVEKVLHALRKAVKDTPLIADLKIADTGYLSAKIAFEAGADFVTVLGSASDKTLSGAIEAAQEYRGKIMVDLVISSDPREDTKKAINLGADYIIAHTGIDEQRKGKSALDALEKTVLYIPSEKLAVAGGINHNNISLILRYSPAIIIVGGAVIKSKNPESSTRQLKNIIQEFCLNK